MKRVYLDHNATTPMRPQVRAHFEEALEEANGNPSSVHASGRAARARLDSARERVAAALGVDEDEILFTSGGTESDNLAVLGTLRGAPGAGMVTSAIEHSAVLEAGVAAEREGHPLTRVRVDSQGRVDPEELLAAVRERAPALVSLMAANNEVGSLGPLAELGLGLRALGKLRPVFHTDAVQALGRAPLELRAWGLDLASFSAHKLGGPLGVGVLYKRKGLKLLALQYGGGQELGLRPGTENVAALSAAALAIELAQREHAQHIPRMRALCSSFWEQVQRVLPQAAVNGPDPSAQDRLCNTLNLSLPGIDGRVLVARLDLEGLEVSAGSACASGSLEASHVLLAMGRANEDARAGVRISFGWNSTSEDVHGAVDILRRTFSSSR
ncbi:MAG: cysteine desulfurase [Planctomycetes bacterium]|nr:cysteine desulfurase [Planctomycetota bacterium]